MLKLWTVFSKMGVIFSRFKKKSLSELLEDVAEEIEELKACSLNTELRHRKITRQLTIYSSGLSVIIAILLYFYMPQILKAKIILFSLLLLTPILYIVSKIVSWYYRRKIKSSHARLKTLEQEKKRIIDEIMNKETYKVAKDILEKYAPETLPRKQTPIARIEAKPLNLRMPVVQNTFSPMRPPIPYSVGLNEMVRPSATGKIGPSANQPLRALTAPDNVMGVPPQFPQNKSYLEKFLEYLISDGPSTKYALICSKCSTHNGMTLMEEFEYTAFKCYACHNFNPARKQRPLAPKLENDKFVTDHQSDTDTNSLSQKSDSEGVEIEEVEDDKELFGEDSGSRITVDEINKALEMRESLEMNKGNNDSPSSLSVEDENSSDKMFQLGGSENSAEEFKTEPENRSRPWKSADDLNYTESKFQDSESKKIKSESVLNGASDL